MRSSCNALENTGWHFLWFLSVSPGKFWASTSTTPQTHSLKSIPVHHSPLFFAWWRAPQQMLRTHRSLKASCATPVMKMSSFLYQVLQVMEHQWNEIDREKPTTRRKTCPSATLSTTNPTWTDPGSKPGLRGVRPATNPLSHGTAYQSPYTSKLS
jgi:hypothetical protein